eukprot:CAMPEP_0180222250 /NCGR_PEP_ID=MMETSP0987-20121128/20570_1 /TAXON_ID=697907 /ORGANISM="non described non described, Strain CCMP2293" /LENGTH=273 /DNA_ID=CAMNT_0022184245 /DNA_START=108 /DNA_END=925 /DNA_ORIENTATION=+
MDEPAAPVTTPAVVEIPDLQENVRQAPSKEPGPLLYPPMAHSAAYTAGQNVAVDSTVGYPVTVSSEGSDADSQGSHRGSVNGSVNGGGILFHGSPREIFGTGSAGDAAALAEPSYWREVARQTHAMVKKNFILARRNRFSTFLRVFVSFFFILLIFLVNEGIKTRFSGNSSYRDLADPKREVVQGIPECTVAIGNSVCRSFGYAPAPYGQFVPDTDYASLAAFRVAVEATGRAPFGFCAVGAFPKLAMPELNITVDSQPGSGCVDMDCWVEGG